MGIPMYFSATQFRAMSPIDSHGLVRGVSVITEGEATGHGVFVDRKTLETVQGVAAGFSGG
jgi:hypothetical protein